MRVSELLREKSGLNDVGPKLIKQVQPVRPVSPTGPTELSQQNLISEFYRLGFSPKLMTGLSLNYG